MDDAYLAISKVANNTTLQERMTACVAQQEHLGNIPQITIDPNVWVQTNRYIWAASPGWGAAWDSALAANPDDPGYDPGADQAVITDGMILATVQALGNPSLE